MSASGMGRPEMSSWFLVVALFAVVTANGQQAVMDDNARQMIAEGKSTVAVLDFEGRGLTPQESATLTDRLSSELAKTGAVILVERNQMNEILGEQGFQQTGCTSGDCAAEVGALLGVENMISGSFGKLGNTYTIDAKIFSVETGATTKTVSKSYKGEVDGLIIEIEILAWELVNVAAPKDLLERQKKGLAAGVSAASPKRSRALVWAALGLAAAGGGAYYYLTMAQEPSPLPGPPALPN